MMIDMKSIFEDLDKSFEVSEDYCNFLNEVIEYVHVKEKESDKFFEVSKDYYNFLNKVIEYVLVKKKELASELWERLYKETAGSKYLSLYEVVEKIRLGNCFAC